MLNSPIIITVYNRLGHLKRCIDRLLLCDGVDKTELYISSDAAFREQDSIEIKAVREYIQSIKGFANVVTMFAESNKGLLACYENITAEVFKKYDRFIFLEDDVVVSPDFLTYMNQALSYYENNHRVYSISAFSFSVFYFVNKENRNKVYSTNRFYPWGFATWKDRINKRKEYSIEDVRQSLKDPIVTARLHACGKDLYPSFLSLLAQRKMLVLDYLNTFHMVKNNLVTVVPYYTKSFNIGHDGSGNRTQRNKKYLAADLSFLNEPNQVEFTKDIMLDNHFNQLHFNRKTDSIKLLLNRLGLLTIAMKLVNRFRGN